MTWFWIITLQWNNPRSAVVRTFDGTVTAEQAARLGTRAAAFKEAEAAAAQQAALPAGTSVSVLFFSLEPDALVPEDSTP